MPFATFTKVREVSSEDNVHLAENLIKSQPGRKWKTKVAGEKSAYVILEMSDSYQISGIDIGNEHSAFVEVLVGKSSCAPGEFKEILITCSFMTPTESKSSNNINRVRCFGRDALVPTNAEDKWSLVKILCTQPFNKHVQYGLSFIKIHINDDVKNSAITQKNLVPEQFLNKTSQVIGKWKLREDSPDSESENSSSLFNRWKKSQHNDVEPTTAASIRMASKKPMALVTRFNDDQKPRTSLDLKKDDNILDRNREKLLFGDESDDEDPKNQEKLERLSEQIEADKKRRRDEIEKEINKKKQIEADKKRKRAEIEQEIINKKLKSLDSSSKNFDDFSTKPSSSKQSCEGNSSDNRVAQNSSLEKPINKIIPSKKFSPFNQLLKGVVLVISGIQNPDRGDLRNKAIAMGAKYKADWDSTCTHLICAFKNTPKYNQVTGKGKIVTRSWLEKCYSLKRYMPWRRYALDSNEFSKPESDEEIYDDTQIEKTNSNNTDLQNTSLRHSREESEEKSNTLALYDIDDRPNANKSKNNPNSSSSENDTDDEIQRIEKDTKTEKNNPPSKTVDIYDASTDEEDYIVEKLSGNK